MGISNVKVTEGDRTFLTDDLFELKKGRHEIYVEVTDAEGRKYKGQTFDVEQ